MEEKGTNGDGEYGEGEYILVHFRVRCPIRLGQSLAITGSSFSLGLIVEIKLNLFFVFFFLFNFLKIKNISQAHDEQPIDGPHQDE